MWLLYMYHIYIYIYILYDYICITECPSPQLSNHPRSSNASPPSTISSNSSIRRSILPLPFAPASEFSMAVSMLSGRRGMATSFGWLPGTEKYQVNGVLSTPARLKQLCFLCICIYIYMCVCALWMIYWYIYIYIYIFWYIYVKYYTYIYIYIYIMLYLYTHVVTICLYECLFSNLCDMNHFRIQAHPHILWWNQRTIYKPKKLWSYQQIMVGLPDFPKQLSNGRIVKCRAESSASGR